MAISTEKDKNRLTQLREGLIRVLDSKWLLGGFGVLFLLGYSHDLYKDYLLQEV